MNDRNKVLEGRVLHLPVDHVEIDNPLLLRQRVTLSGLPLRNIDNTLTLVGYNECHHKGPCLTDKSETIGIPKLTGGEGAILVAMARSAGRGFFFVVDKEEIEPLDFALSQAVEHRWDLHIQTKFYGKDAQGNKTPYCFSQDVTWPSRWFEFRWHEIPVSTNP